MMKLTAIFRTERKGNVQHMTRDYYNSKGKFSQELRANGLRVLNVFKEEEIEEIKNSAPSPLDGVDKDYIRQVL